MATASTKRRDFATLTALPPYNTEFMSVTTSGYTGHEHGDAFGFKRRRRSSTEFKYRVSDECQQPNTSVAEH